MVILHVHVAVACTERILNEVFRCIRFVSSSDDVTHLQVVSFIIVQNQSMYLFVKAMTKLLICCFVFPGVESTLLTSI